MHQTQKLKRLFEKMANKYHPDKVSHLGKEIQKNAEENLKQLMTRTKKLKMLGV